MRNWIWQITQSNNRKRRLRKAGKTTPDFSFIAPLKRPLQSEGEQQSEKDACFYSN